MLIDDPVKEEGMLRGDLLPFEELFKLHQRRVYAVCLRMTGNTAEAEDLLQEVFIQVFRKLGTFRGESLHDMVAPPDGQPSADALSQKTQQK